MCSGTMPLAVRVSVRRARRNDGSVGLTANAVLPGTSGAGPAADAALPVAVGIGADVRVEARSTVKCGEGSGPQPSALTLGPRRRD